MINKATEVIFIDEASISTMEIDDWKGGEERRFLENVIKDDIGQVTPQVVSPYDPTREPEPK